MGFKLQVYKDTSGTTFGYDLVEEETGDIYMTSDGYATKEELLEDLETTKNALEDSLQKITFL